MSFARHFSWFSPRFAALSLTIAGLSSGCALTPRAHARAPAPAAGAAAATHGDAHTENSEQAALAAQVRNLDAKIAALEGKLGGGAVNGRGAYRDGSSLHVDGGRESVLERARRLDQELAAARAELAARDQRLGTLDTQLADAQAHVNSTADQVDSLGHVRDHLVTAQQELADRNRRLDQAQGQLIASELTRLRAEREFYQLAGDLLKLAPGQAAELGELQQRVRNQARALRPDGVDDTTGAADSANTTTHAKESIHAR